MSNILRRSKMQTCQLIKLGQMEYNFFHFIFLAYSILYALLGYVNLLRNVGRFVLGMCEQCFTCKVEKKNKLSIRSWMFLMVCGFLEKIVCLTQNR